MIRVGFNQLVNGEDCILWNIWNQFKNLTFVFFNSIIMFIGLSIDWSL